MCCACFSVGLQPKFRRGESCGKVGRFVFVLDGEVKVQVPGESTSLIDLHPDDYAYFPPGLAHTILSDHGAGLLVFERIYALKVFLCAHRWPFFAFLLPL